MRDVDCIESGSQSRVNVRAGRVANHPGIFRVKLQFPDDTMIGGNIFFLDNDDLLEILLDPRLFDFKLLFSMSPFVSRIRSCRGDK